MPDATEINLRGQLSVLGRSWRSIALFVLSAMGTSLALTYLFSERYQATTLIMFRPNTEVQLEIPSQQNRTLGFPVSSVYPFETLGLTVKEVCTSDRILRPVVLELSLDQPEPKPVREGLAKYYYDAKEWVKEYRKTVWQILKYGRTIEEDRTDAAIRELAADTSIDTRQKNYLCTLKVLAKYPERAARIADRIGVELIDFLYEQSVQETRARGKELDRRLFEKKSEIDRIRSQIQSLKTANEFISLNEETGLHLKSAEELTLKLALNESDLNAARARLSALGTQRASLSEVVKAPSYNHLRQLEASLEADEVKVKTEIAGLEAAHSTIQANLEKARQRISKPELEAQHNDLHLQLGVLESDYKKLATLREEVRASELTSKAEVFALYPATAQEAPVRPIKVYHVVLAGLLALTLGVGFAFVSDYVRFLLAVPKSSGEGANARVETR
jgi:uncharacterized protein involved in exopolysaccharide biosynthesis